MDTAYRTGKLPVNQGEIVIEQSLKEIDGMSFIIGQLAGRAQVRMFHKLSSSVFPALGLVASKIGEGFDKMDAATLLKILGGEALPRLFMDLDQKTLDELIDGLFASVIYRGDDGKGVPVLKVMDAVFQGKTLSVFKLMAACVEVNYASFFGEAGLAGLLPKAKALFSSESPKTSSNAGPSGASS